MSKPTKVIWRPSPDPESRAQAIRLRKFTQHAFVLTIAAVIVSAVWSPLVTIAIVCAGGATTYYCARSFWRLWLESEQAIQRVCHRVRHEGALPTWVEISEELDILREASEEPIEVQCDARFVPACVIPAGTYDFRNVVFNAHKRPNGGIDGEEERK